MKKLIIVDMQNDFVYGALGTKEAVAIVDNVVNKLSEYKGNKHYVCFTADTHYGNYLSTQEGKNLPVPHCIDGTHGWTIIEELDVTGALIVQKETFGSDTILNYFIDGTEDEVEIVGLCTDICVISNALLIKAFFPELLITVDASCCAGVTPESHKNALSAMKMCQINIINEE